MVNLCFYFHTTRWNPITAHISQCYTAPNVKLSFGPDFLSLSLRGLCVAKHLPAPLPSHPVTGGSVSDGEEIVINQVLFLFLLYKYYEI